MNVNFFKWTFHFSYLASIILSRRSLSHVLSHALVTIWDFQSFHISVQLTLNNFLSCIGNLEVIVVVSLQDLSATGITHYKTFKQAERTVWSAESRGVFSLIGCHSMHLSPTSHWHDQIFSMTEISWASARHQQITSLNSSHIEIVANGSKPLIWLWYGLLSTISKKFSEWKIRANPVWWTSVFLNLGRASSFTGRDSYALMWLYTHTYRLPNQKQRARITTHRRSAISFFVQHNYSIVILHSK